MSTSLTLATNLAEYTDQWEWIKSLRDRNMMQEWEEAMRYYVLNDLFFLLNFVSLDGKTINTQTGKPLFFHDVYLDICKINQYYINNLINSFNGSTRRLGKSTIRTRYCSIQMALRNPEISIGIFSLLRYMAKKHLSGINDELKNNKMYYVLFPHILYDDPVASAKNGETVWSNTDGLRFKRNRVRLTQTIEHGAFLNERPTGSGYDVIHFDDCEDNSVVSNQENITKLHLAYSAAAALATPAVLEKPLFFITNTFYHPDGIAKKKYNEYMKSDPCSVSVYPAEDLSRDGDGPLGGTPQYPFTTKLLQQAFDEVGKDDYAIQFCCDFNLGQDRSMSRDWLTFYPDDPKDIMSGKNSYICIDASKGVYDPMAIFVWSASAEKKLFWTDGRRKKLDPASPLFFDEIFNICNLVANFSDRLVEIRVEQMHQQTWAELISSELKRRGLYISVIPCRGKLDKARARRFETAKLEREWQRWVPALQRGEIIFPKSTTMGGHGIVTTDEKGRVFDLVDYFLNSEYDRFPRASNDDLLDAGGLIWEPEANPIEYPTLGYKKYKPSHGYGGQYSWMSAG